MARTNAGRRKGSRSFAINQVPTVNVPRSALDLSHHHKTTYNSGQLIPVFWEDCLPGDTWKIRMAIFQRVATLLYPLMDELITSVHFWFVPYRLVWEHWVNFCGEKDTPSDTTTYSLPQIDFAGTGVIEQSNFDYMGLPLRAAYNNTKINALPFRALALVWDEWYRDENLQNPIAAPNGDGPDSPTIYNTPYRRGKRKDLFAGALPWPQKGPEVTIPLGTSAPLQPISTGGGLGVPTWTNGTQTDSMSMIPGPPNTPIWSGGSPSGSGLATWAEPGLEADLSSATAATIALLRQQIAIQQLYERDARGGTRYVEHNWAHFGVRSADQRLMRPEFLGGGQVPLQVTPVPATNSQTGEVNLGELAAYGTGAGMPASITHSTTEHGVILGVISTRAPLTYQQGLDRFWTKRDRWEMYYPGLAHIGEQAILNQEIYHQDSAGTGTLDDVGVFGYNERYYEYKQRASKVTGLLRSNPVIGASLDPYHLAQDFTALPRLDATYIQDTPPVKRVIKVETEPDFIADMKFNVTAIRPMPVYSTPGLRRL